MAMTTTDLLERLHELGLFCSYSTPDATLRVATSPIEPVMAFGALVMIVESEGGRWLLRHWDTAKNAAVEVRATELGELYPKIRDLVLDRTGKALRPY